MYYKLQKGGLTEKYTKARIDVMAIVNQAIRELQLKIVYYGVALAGKTTNLVRIQEHVKKQGGQAGKIVTLETSSDRTLFFDFLPLETVTIEGFKVELQLYTVPGQVLYNTTRQLVLRGVDGIVFVADSERERMEENKMSFQNLEDNLASLGRNLSDIPYVLQYNKRNIAGASTLEHMEFLLNNREVRASSFPASADEGMGVLETLDVLTAMVVQKIRDQNKNTK